MDGLEHLDLDIQLLTHEELDLYETNDFDGTITDRATQDGLDFDDNLAHNEHNLAIDDVLLATLHQLVPEEPIQKFPVSLLVRGKVIPCIRSVILESEYLSNMSELFENCDSLPVPDTVSSKDINEITECVQILKMTDSPGYYMEKKFNDMDLEYKIDLLIICDLLGYTRIQHYIVQSVLKCVNHGNWKLIYSRCSEIMGLSVIVDHLLDFLLHTLIDKKSMDSLSGWTELVSFHFLERILTQSKYDISEEAKFEFLMDWMSFNSGMEEKSASLLSMICFKCFNDVHDIQQAETDLAQLEILNEEHLAEIISKTREAINFKHKSWELEKSVEDVAHLLSSKSVTCWPKLLGFANYLGSTECGEYQLLNNGTVRLSGRNTFHCMSNMRRALSYCPNISYKSSVFYIHYPKSNIPQLCQFNFDYQKCFHVLDLPLSLRSINDQHKSRSNLVMICNVGDHLYLFSKDAFSKQNFDTPEKLKVFRIDLALAVESCNEFLALKNALLLKWEHFTDIPEAYLEGNDNNFDYDIKAVDVGEDIFIVSNDLCISLNIQSKVWSERELSPPARNNPVVLGSDSELFIIGGTCMGQPLVSGQKYNTETWEMHLLPNIPLTVFPLQNLKYYKGLHFKNFLYLYRGIHDSCGGEGLLLVFDLFTNLWECKPAPVANLYCLEKPIWI